MKDGTGHGTGYGTEGGRVLDTGRFLLLSLVTVPFAGWVSSYSYAYLTRETLCRRTIEAGSRSLGADSWRVGRDVSFGRGRELSALRALEERRQERGTSRGLDDLPERQAQRRIRIVFLHKVLANPGPLVDPSPRRLK